MTYRWEPTTPLDRILESGFKRIDEAVEGVIRKHCPRAFANHAILNNSAGRARLMSGKEMKALQELGVSLARGYC